jgi:predicted hotdog family 3-hydroxylacyl-ACP dehydratase
MLMNRAWIAARIPHQAGMCLLDEVLDFDNRGIRCRTGTHRASDNPLRAHGRLGAACGIEYAAQAMALHGALALDSQNSSAAAPSRVGLLASVREVRQRVLRLDDVESDILCEVRHVAGDGFTALYEFELRDGARMLLSGRASVVLDAGGKFGL